MARNAQLNLRVRPTLKAKLEKLRRKICGRSAVTLRSYLRIMLRALLRLGVGAKRRVEGQAK